MPKIEVKKSISIAAPAEKVFACIADLNAFAAWSPWLILEPETIVSISEDRKYYEWEGQRIGSGHMKIVSEQKNESVDYDLTFLKPWKSEAKVRFELQGSAEGTEAIWIMQSSLPWFMFWMKKLTLGFIGVDFQRGLLLLKDYAEDGHIHSSLDFTGTASYPGCTFVGIANTCWMDDLGPSMQNDFDKLQSFFADKTGLAAGAPLSIYHKWDIANGEVKYTAAVPVKDLPENLPSYLSYGEIPPTSVYKVTHTGPYHHLGTPWSAISNLQRSKVFKTNKKIHPFEIYLNMPGEVPDDQLITEVVFPTR